MLDQVRLAFLLTVTVLAYGDAAAFAVEQSFPATEKSIQVANLDKIFDDLQPVLRDNIVNNGMDPMEVSNISGSFISFLPWKLKGSIKLTNGWVQGLSGIKRAGHIIGTYSDKRLTLDMDLGIDILDLSYQYYAKYLFLKRSGDVYVRFNNIDIKVVITIDLAKYRINLDKMHFLKVRKYDIKLEGNLMDRFLNMITKTVTVIFRKCVLLRLERRTFMIINDMINEWNKTFPRPKGNLNEISIEKWFYNDIPYASMENMQFY